MSSHIEAWPAPDDPNAFELLCLDFFKDIWGDPGAQKNGRLGQSQAGVDIFGMFKGRQIGVQCKQKDGLLRKKLSKKELEQEVEAAKMFLPPLAKFILATTGPRDADLQERARVLSEKHKSQGLFEIQVWSWKDIWDEIYRREKLLERIGPLYWPKLAKKKSNLVAHCSVIIFVVALGGFGIYSFVKHGHGPVKLPHIAIATIDGYTLEDFTEKMGPALLPENRQFLKQHHLLVRNDNNMELVNITGTIQLPEPIVYSLKIQRPAGVEVLWDKDQSMMMLAKGDVTMVRGPLPMLSFKQRLEIDRLAPGQSVLIPAFA